MRGVDVRVGPLLLYSAGCGVGLLTTSCIPFVAPPTSVSVGPAVVIGSPIPREHREAKGGDPDRTYGLVTGRVGARPLGIIPDFSDRTFDFQFGYVFEVFPHEAVTEYEKHGGFLGVTHFPWVSAERGGGRARLGVNAMGEALYSEAVDEVGGGMTFQLDLEYLSYQSGTFAGVTDDGGGLAGGALGEMAIGLNAYGGARMIGTVRYWVVGGGLSVRLPAAGGVLFVPLSELFD